MVLKQRQTPRPAPLWPFPAHASAGPGEVKPVVLPVARDARDQAGVRPRAFWTAQDLARQRDLHLVLGRRRPRVVQEYEDLGARELPVAHPVRHRQQVADLPAESRSLVAEEFGRHGRLAGGDVGQATVATLWPGRTIGYSSTRQSRTVAQSSCTPRPGPSGG